MSTPSPRAPEIREAMETINVRADEGVTTANNMKDMLGNDMLTADVTN